MPNSIPPGTVLNNRYQVIRLLSDKGGFGLIYLGQDQRTGQQVAIKQNRDTSTDSHEQFKREADLLLPLAHPNLVKVYTYFEDAQSKQFLVMEFVQGEDLWDMAGKRAVPFPETEVLQWGKILCDVLTYLHTQNPPIIHRDIKPHNVKLQPIQGGSRVVLIDFGIAKEYRAGQKTQRGAQAWTPGFSPLEQQCGTGTMPRSDLYALGATMYCLLTLQVPEEAIERTAQQKPLALHVINPTLSGLTIQAVTRAMEINPQGRFQTASEMGQALGQSLRSLGVTAPPVGVTALPVYTTAQTPCIRCGTLNRANARFCQKCGAPVNLSTVTPHIACPYCGSPNRGSAKRCSTCGRPLGPMPVPAFPSLPLPPQPVASLSPGQCPNCRQANPPGEMFCQNCGYQLQALPSQPMPSRWPSRPAPQLPSQSAPATPFPPLASQRPSLPSPPVAPAVFGSVLPEQVIAGRILTGWGVVAIAIGLWVAFLLYGVPLGILFGGLGFLTVIAGRDLSGLFQSSQSNAPGWLQFAFGDANRGRRRGTVLAALWIVIGMFTAWLIVPLGIAGVMAYVLHILIGKPLVESTGGHYARPGLITVIGWTMAFSGIGTVPGIALLIPKTWAKQWAIAALWLTALVGALGILFSFAALGTAGGSSPLDYVWIFIGTNVKIVALSLLTASFAVSLGSLAAVQYLRTVQLNPSTQTAMRRELNVAAWTMLAAGIATMLTMPFWAILTDWGTPLFWMGLLIGGTATVAARDLLELGNNRLQGLPGMVGSMERGRTLGIVAAVAMAIVAAALAWGFVSLIFLAIAVFVLRILLSPQTINLCNGNLQGPTGVMLIAWLLIPTGIGAVPGILMLKPDPRGWRWARGALVALSLIGLGLTLWALATILQMSTDRLPWTIACIGAGMAVSTGLALNYLQSTYVRRYFGV